MSSCFTMMTWPDQQKLSQPKRIWKYLVHGLQSKLSFLDRSTRRCSSTLAVNHASLRHDRQYHHYHHHYHYCYSHRDDHHQHQQCNGRKMEALKGFDNDDHRHDDDDEDGHGHVHDQDHEKGLNNTPSTTCSSNNGTVRVQRLNGVDAEAEKFIDNFYKKLSLERQESAEEFFDMLARSS